ncbi:uncharacterized protein N7479_005767 [Penicillium vulpinum]|nr:uncharacterized protein N7479_005767 [Penicillium vulpinum]KAJ5958617.1 hypothetical protein N7479_005767 [Penicillium vulpinum]
MVTHEHHTVVRAFDLAIDDVLRPMGMDEKVLTYAGVDIDVDGISKQPDWGWGPRRPPLGQPRRRPTVVIEVAMSETRAKLHRDVELWVDPERGNMNIAFTVKVNRNCAIITIGKWEWDYANNQARMSQEIEIHKNEAGDHVTVSGAPLIIPFNLLFLRYAIPPKETDLTIKGEKFEYIADLVWELQFADF